MNNKYNEIPYAYGGGYITIPRIAQGNGKRIVLTLPTEAKYIHNDTIASVKRFSLYDYQTIGHPQYDIV